MHLFYKQADVGSIPASATIRGEIAQKYGGGGHKRAAGFQIDDITKIIGTTKEGRKNE